MKERKKVRNFTEYKESLKVKDNTNYGYFPILNEVVDFGEYLFDSIHERVVYETLLRYSNNNDDLAKAGLQTLSKKSLMSKNTLLKNIRSLEEKGYIEVIETAGQNTTNIYHTFDIRNFITEEMIKNYVNDRAKSYKLEASEIELELEKLMVRYGFEAKKEEKEEGKQQQGGSPDELPNQQGGSPDEQGGSPDEQGGSCREHNKEHYIKELILNNHLGEINENTSKDIKMCMENNYIANSWNNRVNNKINKIISENGYKYLSVILMILKLEVKRELREDETLVSIINRIIKRIDKNKTA